ncbi:hypothetical protein ACN9MB_17485 [Dyella kyungheensis]|uniref:hypothetical protein n=1 Tax=Dyella kyungheensis TaxID=1242174 RepID=UPI003CEF9563
MQNATSKLKLIDYLLTREGFKRVMVTLILSSIVLTWGLGIFTGGLSRGLRESSRDGGRRFGYMSKVARGFKEQDDPYVMIFQSSKAGQAYMELRFFRSDWDRTAGSDLAELLQQQGWSHSNNGSSYCLDDASLTVSRGVDYVDVIMSYSNPSIRACRETESGVDFSGK